MLSFQDVIMRLQEFWAGQGAVIWQPYSEKVGAGTLNPATVLRVLGPEPWNVAYVEPSYRPDDGRYGDNPNRMQMFYQYQVILKPDPGDPQERYLRSLEALGIRREEHDIRFVEDNWESPALGAWGLGWEVWLDGLEITQFTYFQQAGGINLDPPAVEITYGLERIVMFLQGVRSVWDINWDGQHTYGEIFRDQEVDYCRYQFEKADIERLQLLYKAFEDEALLALDHGLAVPALDYILRCSHTFNILDARGAVGITERARFFKRMRALARRCADNYLAQRERAGYPWKNRPGLRRPAASEALPLLLTPHVERKVDAANAPFVFEIGVEELPPADVDLALAALRERVPAALAEARLDHGPVTVYGTPRRLVVLVESLALRQRDEERLVKGPAAKAAFDAEGRPTRAAEGFARSQGVALEDLRVQELGGGTYVVAIRRETGRPAAEVLGDVLTQWLAGLKFPRAMRWNETGIAFSRPLRWLVALHGEDVIPLTYAGVTSGRVTRGPRSAGSPEVALASAWDYLPTLEAYGIVLNPEARRDAIRAQVTALAEEVGGVYYDDPALLNEVAHLVEVPTALRGSFEERYLALPPEVLVAVMKKHQRYFPVKTAEGRLLPYFITIRNGGREYGDIVVQGNADVLRARYADAEYFFQQDTRKPLEAFLPRLDTLVFQESLGSMLDKTRRIEALVPWLSAQLGLDAQEQAWFARAAHLAKADLATELVIEMTSLQGIMGREYALRSGEPREVAEAIGEQYRLPKTRVGAALVLADRLDSLIGLFAAGLMPTASADPYGLRRAALDVIETLIHHRWPLRLDEGLAQAAALQPIPVTEEQRLAVLDFVRGRLRGVLRELGFAYDTVEAVLGPQGHTPYLALMAAQTLSAWIARPDWPQILANYARCARIIRGQAVGALDPARLREPAELALYAALQAAETTLAAKRDLETLLALLEQIQPHIATFFDAVLVMADDPEVRAARLALLARLVALADGLVDLSKLEGF